ncbi:MAG: CPBP family intramembrane metalloprotease [Lachnospiraceae bacterium]|jgi:membrane protease YdiL (CAAX protease family)|nr:CPBP family intramembrane metalloprotease [Lachnospiraceae bacterium]
MTTNKGANRTFLITVIIYILLSFVWSIVSHFFDIPFSANSLLTQTVVFLPAFLYIKISGMKVRELIPYRRIKISDALQAIAMTYLFYPLLIVVNLITMFFVDNETAGVITTAAGEQSLFWNVVFIALLPACVEEFVFRGMLYQTYKKSSLLVGVLLSAFLFGCMHMNFNQFAYAFVFGLVLALTLEATGSIFTSMLCHFVLNLNSVLLITVMGHMQGGNFSNTIEESSTLMDHPKLLLMGALSWIVIAVFTTIGAVGIWIHLAKKNGNLERIQKELKKPTKEKIFSIPLLLGILMTAAVMVFMEVLKRI